MVAGASVQLAFCNIRINGVAPRFPKASVLTLSNDAEKGAEYRNDQRPEKVQKNHGWFFEQSLKAPEYYSNRMADANEIENIQFFLASDLVSSINVHVVLAE